MTKVSQYEIIKLKQDIAEMIANLICDSFVANSEDSEDYYCALTDTYCFGKPSCPKAPKLRNGIIFESPS
jgi:hypothetical protein